MKIRWFAGATAAALICGFGGAYAAAEEPEMPEIIVGDANGDGSVDAADASLILAHYAELSSGHDDDWSAELTAACDIDESLSVDAADASGVLAYYSYLSTIAKDAQPMEIRKYVAALASKGVAAPEGLDPGLPGTVRYIVNTAELKPHDEIPLYNIKENNKMGGKPYYVRSYTVTPEDKAIMDAFAEEHFTPEMTNYDRLEYACNWLHDNVVYANGVGDNPPYSEVSSISFVEACFVKKMGQCIQYNGAMAELMAYMGYNSYMLEQWNGANNTMQHFAVETEVGGVHYSTEVGERSYDNAATGYRWMWFFDKMRARFHGLEDDGSGKETA